MEVPSSEYEIPQYMSELRCPDCDGTFERRWEDTTIPYGTGDKAADIPVRLPLYTCVGCGLQTLDIEGERLEHEAVCHYHGILSPREIKHIRKMHGMTRDEFAHMTGIGESSLGRWERALSMQSPAYDKYLRLLQQPEIFSLLQRGFSVSGDPLIEPSNIVPFPNIPTDVRAIRQVEVSIFNLATAA